MKSINEYQREFICRAWPILHRLSKQVGDCPTCGACDAFDEYPNADHLRDELLAWLPEIQADPSERIECVSDDGATRFEYRKREPNVDIEALIADAIGLADELRELGEELDAVFYGLG